MAYHDKLIEACPQPGRLSGQAGGDPFKPRLVYARLGSVLKSATANEKAIAILQLLTVRHPELPEYALSLAGEYSNAGLGLKAKGKTKDALKLLAQAIELAEAVLRQEPRHATARGRVQRPRGTGAGLRTVGPLGGGGQGPGSSRGTGAGAGVLGGRAVPR